MSETFDLNKPTWFKLVIGYSLELSWEEVPPRAHAPQVQNHYIYVYLCIFLPLSLQVEWTVTQMFAFEEHTLVPVLWWDCHEWCTWRANRSLYFKCHSSLGGIISRFIHENWNKLCHSAFWVGFFFRTNRADFLRVNYHIKAPAADNLTAEPLEGNVITFQKTPIPHLIRQKNHLPLHNVNHYWKWEPFSALTDTFIVWSTCFLSQHLVVRWKSGITFKRL